MAYTKYSLTPSNNTATPPDGAPEGMLPSAVNDTMRDMMAQIRDCGDGIRDGTYTMTAPKITGGTITGAAFTGNTFTSPVISGGSINNTPIGATTANTGAFTTLSATGATTFSGATVVSGSLTANTFSSSGATITGGTINGTAIGGSTASTGAFTTLSASGVATFSAGTVSAPAITTTGDTNTGIYFPAADTIAFTEGGVESMRIDSSGNVMIAGTNADGRLTVTASSDYAPALYVKSNTAAANWARMDWKNHNVAATGIIYLEQTGLFAVRNDGANPIAFYTNGATERMRIDSSGNVGIGTSSPASALDVRATSGVSMFRLTATTGTNAVYSRYENTGGYLYLGRDNSSGTDFGSAYAAGIWSTGAYPMLFGTNGAERMRITSGGNVLVGATSGVGSYRFYVKASSGAQGYLDTDGANTQLTFGQSGGDKAYIFTDNTNTRFYLQSGTSGGVYLANGGTSWTSASDERVKENLEPIENGLTKIASLRAVTGNYINDETKKSKAFLIAQDVQKVLPQAVDASNPDELGLQYADVIPLLVASIQELNAKVEQQAAEIALLKSK